MEDTLYIIVLAAHNILRWIIVGLAIYTLYRNYSGWIKKANWQPGDQKAGTFFTIALDTQMLFGLILYFVLSPLTKAFFTDISTGMSNSVLRFFGFDHILMMLVAIGFAHYTTSSSKRDYEDSQKFKRNAILYSIVVVLIILAIPWTSRPLIPSF